MEPILLIHGYGSEQGTATSQRGAANIYGGLSTWLKRTYSSDSVFELDLTRWISLEDGIGLDDVSRAMDAALRGPYSHLMSKTFHVIIHSTGALVVRNWMLKFAGPNQPIRNLIYLAGANFGSGWADLGNNRLARWGRELFTSSEAGTRILNALELGASRTIDLHLSLRGGDASMAARGVREYVIIGSQPAARWFERPIRFAKEDGSDGVVRVSAANLNFCYARFTANSAGQKATVRDVMDLRKLAHLPTDAVYYDRVEESLPGVDGREVVPLAIPYNTAHSGSDYSVVYGSANREYVEPLLQTALETTNINTWRTLMQPFAEVTAASREESKVRGFTDRLADRGWERPTQYDAHAQVVIRLFDEDERPIDDYDIYFESEPADGHVTAISDLIEHKHRNGVTPNVFMFYLRTEKWDREEEKWKDRFDELKSLTFSIEANEPETDDIQYVPFVLPLDQGAIKKWIRHHTTTVMDVYMRRVPSENVFRIFPA
jgi:pimeloyl-ACP methyl ester carboxylesterase